MCDIKSQFGNPWEVSNIEDFLYYCCPECDLKTKDSQKFVKHAKNSHEKSQILLKSEVTKSVTKVSNSVTDVTKIVTEVSTNSVKLENFKNGEIFHCFICDTQNLDFDRLMEHIQFEHRCQIPKKCDNCDEVFEDLHLYLEHLANMHSKFIDLHYR